MKTNAAMVSYWNSPSRKRAVCLSITRRYGSALTVRGTSWDSDLSIDEDSPASVYYSTSGGAISDVDATAALNVDNAEIVANFDAITEDDLNAGLWDTADYELFVVNPDDLSIGRYPVMAGTIGEITIDRMSFVAELRGAMQRIQQQWGDLLAATCPYNLGDSRCTKDLTAFTVIGTADSVTADGLTWRDSARAEAGPTGGVSIDSITADGETSVVETVTALGQAEGDTVILSAIVGPTVLYGSWQVHEPSGVRFVIFKDITGQSAFVSGTATPAGAESGYFDYGLMTITSGANAGLVREVKSFLPGQWTLQQAFPFPVTGTETYTMVAGCDKLPETCRVKFSNLINFGGEPFVPGIDRMAMVGRAE
jgi:hypothetical protein